MSITSAHLHVAVGLTLHLRGWSPNTSDFKTGCDGQFPNLTPFGKLHIGTDWGRVSDHTWLTIVNDQNDVVDWFKYVQVPYLQQIEMLEAGLKRTRSGTKIIDAGKPTSTTPTSIGFLR